MDTVFAMPDTRIDCLFLSLLAQLQSTPKYSNCAQKLSVRISDSRISLSSGDRPLIAEVYQVAENLLENPFFEGLTIELHEPDRLYGLAPARVFLASK